jgi:hypothetical protein
MKRFVKRGLTAALLMVFGLCTISLCRADVVFSASGVSTDTHNTVSAEVTFDVLPGNVLQVVLKNTSLNPDALRRGDILTGVIWDNTGTDPTLSSLSITRPATSNIYTNATTINNASSLTNRWQFKGRPSGPYTYTNHSATFEYGISTIGGGVFSGPSIGGDNYGIVASAATLDNPSFSNSAFPLVVNSLKFQLNGYSGPLNRITNVRFTFGSGPNYVLAAHSNKAVPEPSSLVLIAIGSMLGGLGWYKRRRHARRS